MPYHWLLFDADGTLFDYDGAEAKALRNTFAFYNFPFQPEYGEIYHEINAALWKRFEQQTITLADLRVRRFAELLQNTHLDVDPQSFSQTYLDVLGQSTDLIPGAYELLQRLSGKYRMAVITNGITQVQRSRMRLSAIKDYFEKMFISEEIGFSKPAGNYFDVVFEGIGYPSKKDVLVIGDSLSSDIRGASDYGLDACWYNPQRQPAPEYLYIKYQIHTLTDLLPILSL
ncbi:MAG: noncanonical pyrimidine nucleotidase, YjjG family [Chloroflexi bacterium HGW-Chloroflexi-10]|nr:MAG: noncanonical pyrimidine nucleotidase, YjjG family [Chloroflexi bacterium HGW-Chloroflexi-10]